MGRRRIEAIVGGQRPDRRRRLVQEHRADATAAFLVLAWLADQRLEQLQTAFPIAVMHTDRIAHQDRRDALRPQQRNPVRFGQVPGNADSN